jgi:6-phosphogluconolactonase
MLPAPKGPKKRNSSLRKVTAHGCRCDSRGKGQGSRVTEPQRIIKSSTDYPTKLEVFSDLEALSRAAAQRFADASVESILSKGKFTVALSGGSTPRSLYLLLGSDHYSRTIDWLNVHIFWADERCVPRDDEQSNFKLAFDTFLATVPIPDENVHRIEGEESPDRGAKEYEVDLREFFGESVLPAFDLILLGLGEDGHTASLFPGSPALAEQDHLAVAVDKRPPQPDRITLTLPVLNNALRIIFLVSGGAKAHILREILENPETRGKYPGGLVHLARGRLTWLVDKAAAALLQKEYPPVHS